MKKSISKNRAEIQNRPIMPRDKRVANRAQGKDVIITDHQENENEKAQWDISTSVRIALSKDGKRCC